MIYAVNAVTLAASKYSLSVLGIAAHDRELYLVQSDQLARLAPATVEEGLVGQVETGFYSLGSDEKKYIAGFRAALFGDGTTNAWVTIELDGDTIEIGPYELVGRSGPASFVRRWRIGWGLKADSVSLRFEAADGTAWKLQGLVVNTELV